MKDEQHTCSAPPGRENRDRDRERERAHIAPGSHRRAVEMVLLTWNKIESEGARPTHPRARAVTLHICSVGPARLRPPSHLTTAPRLLRPSLTHLVPPAPAHTRDPLCSPTRWAQVLVSGSTGSYRQGSCRSSR